MSRMSENTEDLFIPLPADWNKEMEEAMNEPLPNEFPDIENDNLSDLSVIEEKDSPIEHTKVQKNDEPVSISLVKVSKFTMNKPKHMQRNNSSDKIIDTFPGVTPLKNLNILGQRQLGKTEDADIKDFMQKSNMNAKLNSQIEVPHITPIKFGKENFLNPMRKPKQIQMKGKFLTGNTGLGTPNLLSCKFRPVVHTSQDGFRTPMKHSFPEITSNHITPFKTESNNDFKKLKVNGTEYLVMKDLGKGGSSVVYQCFEPISKENRAIKCVSLESPSSQGYLEEIRALKRLQYCDRIIKIFDHQQIGGKKLYVVLEMGSADLSQILRELSKHEKQSPSYLIIFYWMEMLCAVQQIHQHGIIHSDLKPENFLLVNGKLKLIDFGISSCMQGDTTSVIKTVSEGSSNYISPEALNCEYSSNKSSPNYGKPKYKISYKADVWSLGCILYQLVYKKTPFQHITPPMAKLLAIANSRTQVEYPNGEKISGKFLETMKKCLQFSAKLRPSVNELILEYDQL